MRTETIANHEQLRFLSQKISRLRKANGFTQKELANICGISPSYLSKLEIGCRIQGVSLEILMRLCTVLNVELYQLFRPPRASTTLHETATVYANRSRSGQLRAYL